VSERESDGRSEIDRGAKTRKNGFERFKIQVRGTAKKLTDARVRGEAKGIVYRSQVHIEGCKVQGGSRNFERCERTRRGCPQKILRGLKVQDAKGSRNLP
jgi:hypothetical protein